MTNLKLVRHQLICMLPVSFTKIFMKKNAVTNCQAAIDAINEKEYQIRHILSKNNQTADCKQHYESYTDTSHITCKTLRLTLWTEIKYAENKHS